MKIGNELFILMSNTVIIFKIHQDFVCYSTSVHAVIHSYPKHIQSSLSGYTEWHQWVPNTPRRNLVKMSFSEAILKTVSSQSDTQVSTTVNWVLSEIYPLPRDFAPRWGLNLNMTLILNCHNAIARGCSYYHQDNDTLHYRRWWNNYSFIGIIFIF